MEPQGYKGNSIALIILYFGKWPNWFNIFLQSCCQNRSVQFIIFTDCIIPSRCPPNTSFIPFTLECFNKLATEKLGLEINLQRAYKICDLRPAFGLIFEDYVSQYVFWGHTDIDIIWGDISEFITDDILSQHDIITSRKNFITGHFTLYRNKQIINELFLKSKDYKKVFTSDCSLCFDECNNLWWKLIAGYKFEELESEVESITHVVRKEALNTQIKVFWGDDIVLEQDRVDEKGHVKPFVNPVIYYKGKIFGGSENIEFMYFHFHFLKKHPELVVPDWKTLPQIFCAKPNGFFEIIETES
ncbi:MAG: hypothetical protein IT249_06310 [Chitinophagaceae bacterium]|nr:hypothetical protein [Chitinophagaceae bacterium]